MNALLALFTFGMILTAIAQVGRHRLLKAAQPAGWTVEPTRATPTSIGPSIAKTFGEFTLRVSLPILTAENWGREAPLGNLDGICALKGGLRLFQRTAWSRHASAVLQRWRIRAR